MTPDLLKLQIAEALHQTYQLSLPIELDFQPDLDRPGQLYKTEICDRLSAELKIAPSVISRTITEALKQNGTRLQTDSRGFIFADFSDLDHQPAEPGPLAEKLYIYIQPPATASLSCSYIRLLSGFFLQLEFLRPFKTQVEIVIPFQGELAVRTMQGETLSDFVLSLFNQIQQANHIPALDDLTKLSELLAARKSKSPLSLWLSYDLLSLGSVARALDKIKSAAGSAELFSVHTEKIENNSDSEICQKFINMLASRPVAVCAYLATLEHYLDLDWDTPELSNWLNLKFLLDSLLLRLKGQDSPKMSTKSDKILQDRIAFLSYSLPLMHYRAAFCGASVSLLRGLKELAMLCHRSINTGSYPEAIRQNNSYGIIENLSSIIK